MGPLSNKGLLKDHKMDIHLTYPYVDMNIKTIYQACLVLEDSIGMAFHQPFPMITYLEMLIWFFPKSLQSIGHESARPSGIRLAITVPTSFGLLRIILCPRVVGTRRGSF